MPPPTVGEHEQAGEVGGHGLIGVGPLGDRGRPVETYHSTDSDAFHV